MIVVVVATVVTTPLGRGGRTNDLRVLDLVLSLSFEKFFSFVHNLWILHGTLNGNCPVYLTVHRRNNVRCCSPKPLGGSPTRRLRTPYLFFIFI